MAVFFFCLCRLYVKAVMMGFKRGMRNQHENTALLKLENVKEAESAKWYAGKRVCYIYRSLRQPYVM